MGCIPNYQSCAARFLATSGECPFLISMLIHVQFLSQKVPGPCGKLTVGRLLTWPRSTGTLLAKRRQQGRACVSRLGMDNCLQVDWEFRKLCLKFEVVKWRSRIVFFSTGAHFVPCLSSVVKLLGRWFHSPLQLDDLQGPT